MLPDLSRLRTVPPVGALLPGQLTAPKKGSKKFYTGVYVFARDPATRDIVWAFGRKIRPEMRIPISFQNEKRFKAFSREYLDKRLSFLPDEGAAEIRRALIKKYNVPLTGAAGTKPQWWGKWSSLGGGSDPDSDSILDAARRELNDEGAIRPRIEMDEIFVPGWSSPSQKGARLLLSGADTGHSGTHILVFEWLDFQSFIRMFPPIGERTFIRGGPGIASASHGEIDFAASLTLQQIREYVVNSLNTKENFFTAYTIESFVMNVLPLLGIGQIANDVIDANELIQFKQNDGTERHRRPDSKGVYGWRDRLAPYLTTKPR